MKNFIRLLLLLGILAWVLRAAFVWQVRDTLVEPLHDPFLQGEKSVSLEETLAVDGQRGYALKYITDMSTYVRIARVVLGGDLLGENVTISPLAPLCVLPLLLWMAGNSLVGAMMLQGFAGFLTVVLVGLVGRRYAGEKAALVAAAAAALYATFILYDSLPLTEAAINVCVLLTFLAFLRLREKPSYGRAAALGLAFGLSIAAKPTLIILPPVCLLAELIEGGRRSLGRLLPHLAVAVLFGAAVLFPFAARARLLSGEWLFLRANTGYAVLMGNSPGAPGSYYEPGGEYGKRFEEAAGTGRGSVGRRDRIALRWALDFWRQQPRAAMGLLLRKIAFFLDPFEIPNNVSMTLYRQISFLGFPVFVTSGILWPFSLLGLAVAVVPKARRWALPLVFVISYSALIVTTFVVARFRLPVVPFLIIAAGAGVAWLADGRTARRVRLAATLAVLAGLVFFHRDTLRRHAVPLLHPEGFSVSMDEGRLFRDGPWSDSGRANYSAALSHPRGRIVKDIVIDPDALRGADGAALMFRAAYAGKGRIVVGVNDFLVEMDMPPGDPRSVHNMRIPVAPSWLRERNRIFFQVRRGTVLRMFLDDEYRYGRSFLSREGEPLSTRNLDVATYQVRRFAHIPQGEFHIGILLND